MKPLEWVAAVAILIGGGALAVVVALIATLPYLAFGAVILVCLRYLGWF